MGLSFESSFVRSAYGVNITFRDMAGEEFRLLFPFIPSLSVREESGRVTLERGNVFPQISHVAGFSQLCTHITPQRADKTRCNPSFHT